MKNFNLKNYGVQEMNLIEIQNSNGGSLWETFLSFYQVASVVVEADMIAFKAYVDYSARTGGAYVIHHAQ
jgi:hypothetical protein